MEIKSFTDWEKRLYWLVPVLFKWRNFEKIWYWVLNRHDTDWSWKGFHKINHYVLLKKTISYSFFRIQHLNLTNFVKSFWRILKFSFQSILYGFSRGIILKHLLFLLWYQNWCNSSRLIKTQVRNKTQTVAPVLILYRAD